jgi:hypothetical protein
VQRLFNEQERELAMELRGKKTSVHSCGRVVTAVAMGVLMGSAAIAKDDQGGGWKPRIQQLEAAVAALQVKQLPVEAAVDCSNGGSIADALVANAEGIGLLTITVTGTCVETIHIARSKVLLKGHGGATIQAPANALFIVNVDNNVSNVTLDGFTITGASTAAVLAQKGAHAVVKNSILQQAGTGAMALDNGVLDVTSSTVTGNSNGVYAARGGVVSVSNSTIAGNTVGVLAWKAGTVNLTSSVPDYSAPGVGPIVENNTTGILVRSGGFAELADTTVQSNLQGMVVDSGGAAHFFTRLNGDGNRIVSNVNYGILAQRNGSLVFSDTTNTITSNLRGIVCVGNPSYVIPQGFVVSGNPGGDIVNCAP